MVTKAAATIEVELETVSKEVLVKRLDKITAQQRQISAELNAVNERRNQLLAQLNMAGGAANEVNELINLFPDEDEQAEDNSNGKVQ